MAVTSSLGGGTGCAGGCPGRQGIGAGFAGWLAVVALALGALAGAAGASPSHVPPGQQHYFRTEATGGTDRHGRPVVSGYVYNSHGLPAFHVQLDVEVLDTGGQVLSRTVSYEDTMVPNFGRAYFEQRVPALGASYRVTVRSVEWMRTGGM